MNVKPVKRTLKFLGLWLALVVVVLLLTLLFNFFGTLSCAALAGMMLGAIKHRRWLALPVSAVFPGVVFALMFLSKVELQGGKRIVVPLLCLGVFWMIFGLTSLMMGFERERRSEDGQTSSLPGTPAANPIADLQLEQLQGRWRYEGGHGDGHRVTKVIEWVEGHLKLSVFDSAGRLRLRAEGDVHLRKSPEAAQAPRSDGNV